MASPTAILPVNDPVARRRIPRKRHGRSVVRTQAPLGNDRPLDPLVSEFSSTFGYAWGPVTRRKHRDDFERFFAWLRATDRPVTLASFDFLTLAAYVAELRTRPKIQGVWHPRAGAWKAVDATCPIKTLSLNSINAYLRPLRWLAIWLVDEGIHPVNPFRKSRRRAAFDPLLPAEETPPKGATLEDLEALERGCAGERPSDYRDRALLSILKTTGARNSSARLLAIDDVDFEREIIRFRRAKGAKTLEVALHREVAAAVLAYLAFGRPALVQAVDGQPDARPDVLFVSECQGRGVQPLSMNALSRMLTRRYHAGGGSLPYFGSHRIRHATATLLANNGMPLDEVSRYLGHSSTAMTRRYAQQSAGALGIRAADALARAGLTR